MAEGTAHALTCHATQAEAATAFCASVVGVSSSGAITCDGADASAVLSTAQGGSVELPWVLRVEPASGTATTRVATTQLHACERYDLTYWQPYIGAWVAVLIAILGARIAITRTLARETL